MSGDQTLLSAYPAAAATIRRYPGAIPIVAFDFDPKSVEYMRSWLIAATHTQRQYYEDQHDRGKSPRSGVRAARPRERADQLSAIIAAVAA